MRVAEPSSPGAAANAGTPGDCGDLAPYLSAERTRVRAPRGLEENISMRVAEPSSPGAAANAGTPGDCGDLAPYLSAGHFERSERRECQGTRTSRSER